MIHVAGPPSRSCSQLSYTAALLRRGVSHAAQDPTTPPTSLANALPPNATGEIHLPKQLRDLSWTGGEGVAAECHRFRGAPADFTDCSTNTVEPFGDWNSVVHRGGPIRGLDHHMPAFGDALSDDQIESVIKYLWTLCDDSRWPRGDLNFPRAFFTEKAFPESETVWTTGITPRGAKAVANELVLRAPASNNGASTRSSFRLNSSRRRRREHGSKGSADVELRSGARSGRAWITRQFSRPAARSHCRLARMKSASAKAPPSGSRLRCSQRDSAQTASCSCTAGTWRRAIAPTSRTRRTCVRRGATPTRRITDSAARGLR
jgi:hypothetical protein